MTPQGLDKSLSFLTGRVWPTHMPSHMCMPQSALSKQDEAITMPTIEGCTCSFHPFMHLAAAQKASGG